MTDAKSEAVYAHLKATRAKVRARGMNPQGAFLIVEHDDGSCTVARAA